MYFIMVTIYLFGQIAFFSLFQYFTDRDMPRPFSVIYSVERRIRLMTYKIIESLMKTIKGKTPNEVIKILGKPDDFSQDTEYFYLRYNDKIYCQYTEKKHTGSIQFKRGVVLGIIV